MDGTRITLRGVAYHNIKPTILYMLYGLILDNAESSSLKSLDILSLRSILPLEGIIYLY